MKKFLTVLLALSVVFTYTVGTAFAAMDSDAITEAKGYIDQQASQYLDGDFEQAANAYMGTMTFDKNGKLLKTKANPSFNENVIGKVSKEVIAKDVNNAVDDAAILFTNKIAQYKASMDTASTWDKDAVIEGVKTRYEEAVSETFNDADILGVELTNVIPTQYDIDKANAITELAAYDSSKYSDDKDEWSIKVTNDVIAVGAPTTYTLTAITGKANGTVLTAKEFVEAVVAAQSAVIAEGPAGTYPGHYGMAIAAINTALDMADVAINGHKKGSGAENYYVEAVPTAEDLANDTTVDAAKKTAVKKMEATLTNKAVALEEALDTAIEELNKKATLSASDKEELKGLKEAKANLDAYVAAAKEVYTAQINYEDTVAAVKAKVNAIVDQIEEFTTTNSGFEQAKTEDIFKIYVKALDDVEELKDEAALLIQMKDVNGKPYYDEATINANLEEQIELLLKIETNLDAAKAALAKGQERALISAKIAYIDFINGTNATGLTPVDSKNKKVLNPWHKSDDGASAASGNVTAMAKDSTTGGYAVTATDMYDDAQKAALEALVAETETAIKDATSIPAIEKIFADAHDKYVAIATTEDHLKAWNGALGLAYTNASYDKELAAYAQYFVDKADKLGTLTDYPVEVRTEADIMKNVVYPIVYTAYTADELADKVAEAKAAIDKILTTEEVKAQRKAVEALIAKIPTTVALTDKDVITAAADALEAYKEIPGSTANPVNKTVLENAIDDYEKLAADELDDAYKALKDKKITTADAEAIEALRALYDAYEAYIDDYFKDTESADTTDAMVEALEGKLLDAQVAAAKELMIKLPANPTAKDKAQVEAARAAYEALSLEGQLRIVNTLAYKNLIDAEEALEVNAIKSVEALKITASSVAGKGYIKVKWTVKGDASDAKYQIYRSVKKNSGFGTKPIFTTANKTYKNTKSLKKGTRYYYKVRAFVELNGQKYYSDWSNKAYRVAK